MKKIDIVFAFLALSGLAGCAGGETLQTSYLDIGNTPTLTRPAALAVLRTSAAATARRPCEVKDNGIVGYEGHVLPASGRTVVPFGEWRYSVQASGRRRGNDRTVDEAWYAVALRTGGWGKAHHCYVLWRSVPSGMEADRLPQKQLQRIVGALRSLGVGGRSRGAGTH